MYDTYTYIIIHTELLVIQLAFHWKFKVYINLYSQNGESKPYFLKEKVCVVWGSSAVVR